MFCGGFLDPRTQYEKFTVFACKPSTFGVNVHLHVQYEMFNVFPRKPFTFGCDWALYVSLLEAAREIAHCCPFKSAWGVGTGGKDISHFRELFLQHISRVHPPMVIPERCARRVVDLTEWIVRMHAYPAAYGGFSDVWSCQLRYRQMPPIRVAVKAIRPVIANEERQVKLKAIQQELKVWVGLRHQNVLPLYGITHDFGPFPAFVCPWADNGTLSEYLEKFEAQLDLKRRMQLLRDISVGLKYLHSRNIVHGDLSGSNILINSKGRACLSDFGLSTLFEQVSDTTASWIVFPGNIRWAAPELLEEFEEGRAQLSSQQADIYSFGSVMLQILSGKQPFHGIQREAQIVIMISRGHQPPREPGWDGRAIPDVLWEFMKTCWARPPSKRPSSEAIVRFVEDQQSRLW